MLSGALRYERWKGIDKVATPKLGLVYQPVGDLTVRATWGKSFKAPTLLEVNEPLEGALLPGFIFSPAPQPPGSTVLLLGGGNGDLRSEHATTWSATAGLSPHWILGLDLQASYFHVDYRDRIGTPLTGTLTSLGNPLFRDLITFNPTADEVNALIAQFPQGLINETGGPFNSADVGAIIDGTASEQREPADPRGRPVADYHLDLAPDQQAAAHRLRILSQERSAAGRRPAGDPDRAPSSTRPLARPRRRFVEGRRFGLSAFVNYVGSTIDNRFPANDRVGAFVTLDVNASLRTGAEAGALGNLELRISALNLLNEEPDRIANSEPEAPPYDSTNQSPVGRFVAFSVRKMW